MIHGSYQRFVDLRKAYLLIVVLNDDRSCNQFVIFLLQFKKSFVSLNSLEALQRKVCVRGRNT